MSTNTDTTTLRPLYAQQHDKNGRLCSGATRRLEIDRAAWADARDGKWDALPTAEHRLRQAVGR